MGTHGYLRILNDENEVSFYYSANGTSRTRVERTILASGFMSLRAGLFAYGERKALFDNFVYRRL